MKYRANREGFTLLELLLVVGIAAVLIISGITLYSTIQRSENANETVKLTNIIIEKTRQLYYGQSSYGGFGNNIEIALYNMNAVPNKYKSTQHSGALINPFDTSNNAVSVTSIGTRDFQIGMRLPPNIIALIAPNFDPAKDANITSVFYCGENETDAIEPSQVALVCGNSSALSGGFNFRIRVQ